MKKLKKIHLLVIILLVIGGGFHFIHAQENLVLPESSGVYSVGYKIMEIEDPERNDIYIENLRRTLGITIWYPTEDSETSGTSYFSDPYLITEMVKRGYNQQDSLALQKMSSLKLNARKNSSVFPGEKFPLLFFSHGLGVSRFNYSTIAQEFTSKGNIVITVDHPYGGFLRTQDGIVRTNRDDKALYSEEGAAILERRMQEWEDDIKFLLDQIFQPKSKLHDIVYSSIDTAKIAALGHSLGGNVALNVAQDDSRIKAAVNLDGGTFSLTKPPLSIPSLTLRSQPDYSDEEILSRGISLEEWKQKGMEIDKSFSQALKGSKLSYQIKIIGAGHMSFSDAPFVLPTMVTRFGGKIIPPVKGFNVIHQSISEFLDAAFHNKAPFFTPIIENCRECKLTNFEEKDSR